MTVDDYFTRLIFIVEKELHMRIDSDYPILKLYSQIEELKRYNQDIKREQEKHKN
jgi:hypothetical protein